MSLLLSFPNARGVSVTDAAVYAMVRGNHILIACPYMTLKYLLAITRLCALWLLLTDLQAWISSQPSEAAEIIAFVRQNADRIHDLPGLHAKLMLSGDRAIFGSANFTLPGLTTNIELGDYTTDDPPRIEQLHLWWNAWWNATQSPSQELMDTLEANARTRPQESTERREQGRGAWTGPGIHTRLMTDLRVAKDQASEPTRRRRRRKSSDEPRICSVCGKNEEETSFYKNRKITLCKTHFNIRNREVRRKSYNTNPKRRDKIKQYNAGYLRDHPEAKEKMRARARAKAAAEREAALAAVAAAPPPEWINLTEAADIIGVTREWARVLKDKGRLGEAGFAAGQRGVLVRRASVLAYKAERDKGKS